MRTSIGLALLVWLAPSAAFAQFCPSYTASSPDNSYGCAIEAVAGTNPTEEEWNDIFDLVSRGPSVWGDAGPTVQDIGQGCGKPERYHEVPARFPCELLKAIAMAESGWTQFCVPTTPPDQVGGRERTIISFDCGYGVSQVTSGMHVGETPSFDRERVASDATYNLATGTRILAGKWSYTECVGDNQPTIIEHWYSATWAYNGLAYVNNPNNPNYDPNRGVYDPAIGGSVPYQEKVFGRIEHSGGKWEPTELAYPNPGEIGNDNAPPELNEPSCGSPTDCAASRAVHPTICDGEAATVAAAGVGGAAVSAGAGGDDGQGGDAVAVSGIVAGEADCSCRAAGAPLPAGWLWALALPTLATSLARRRRF